VNLFMEWRYGLIPCGNKELLGQAGLMLELSSCIGLGKDETLKS
jgi:hypothetical protein